MRGLRHYADPLDLNRDCAMRFGNQNQIYVSRQLFPVTPDERLDHAGLHESACGKPEFFEQQFTCRRKRNQPVDDLPFSSIRDPFAGFRAGTVEKTDR